MYKTEHYHHIHTIESVCDRVTRIMKRGNKSNMYMFHDVHGYDLVTFHFCNKEGWMLIGYDVYDNITLRGRFH